MLRHGKQAERNAHLKQLSSFVFYVDARFFGAYVFPVIRSKVHPESRPRINFKKVEKLNNLSIKVFGYENNEIIQYRLSRGWYDKDCINVLLLHEEREGFFSLYVWFKHINRLLSDQTKYHGPKHFCKKCVYNFSREELLQLHMPGCIGVDGKAARAEMSEKGM